MCPRGVWQLEYIVLSLVDVGIVVVVSKRFSLIPDSLTLTNSLTHASEYVCMRARTHTLYHTHTHTQVGTYLIALAAKSAGVPTYVVADTSKFSPGAHFCFHDFL